MISNNEIDTDLLFKQLVILPENKEKEKVATKLEPTKQDKDVKKLETTTTKISEATTDLRPTIKFAVFINEQARLQLLAPTSNFRKILQSKQLENLIKFVQTNFELSSDLLYTECIWTIGLTPQQEQAILDIKHPNILLSPNVETLVSKEEKLAMFEPFSQFVSSNFRLLSNL